MYFFEIVFRQKVFYLFHLVNTFNIFCGSIDCYDVLNLTRADATAKDIKRAYRKLSLIYHPDKTKGTDDEDEFINACNSGCIDVIQFPFNLLDNLSKRAMQISIAKRKGIELQIRSVFLQGLFFLSSKDMVIQNKNIMNEIFRINMILKKNKLKFADAYPEPKRANTIKTFFTNFIRFSLKFNYLRLISY